METVVVMFFLGTAGIAAAAFSKAKRRRQLKELGELLGGGNDGRVAAWGSALGVMADLRLITRGSGRNSEAWTEIDVELPSKYPFSLLLRRHSWFDAGKIQRGELVDVRIGSRAFDDAFLVEAAPADVVRKLFDREVRQLCLQLRDFQLATVPNTSTLRCELRGWVAVETVREAVAILAKLANSLREAYAQVEAENQPELIGSPFRQEIDDSPARAAAEARELEVARLELVRVVRGDGRSAKSAVAVVFVILAALLGMLAR